MIQNIVPYRRTFFYIYLNGIGILEVNFLCVFLVGILQLLERAGSIHIVSRVDAYLFYILGSYIGYVWVEVYVGY